MPLSRKAFMFDGFSAVTANSVYDQGISELWADLETNALI